MVKPRHKKLDTLLLFDGIAIFFIVTAHMLEGQSDNPLNFVWDEIGVLGLTLFTFSSGYKLMINHSHELGQRTFLSEYYLKRFSRLYKPYIGYSVLTAIPLVIVFYIATTIFHLDFPGISHFFSTIESMDYVRFLSFFVGNNPIAAQLYYLITLIAITSICFTILYFLDLKWLFFLFSPFFLLSLLIQLGILQDVPYIGVFRLLPFFIFGLYWAYTQQNETAKWFLFIQSCAPIMFIICGVSWMIIRYPVFQFLLFCLCCFLFPFFLSSIFGTMKKIRFLYAFFMFCGVYAFPIYLFQWPLILPVVTRIFIDILNLDYFFMPLVVSIITLYLSVFAYQIVKRLHLNILFE